MATLPELKAITGGLSSPGKMAPALAYNLPALESCKVGAKLARQDGTPCSFCYATGNRYVWPSVIGAARRRMAILQACEHDEHAGEQWCQAMAELIRRKSPERFRWHDSGDLLGLWHLRLIARVAELTPDTAHWLPTQERRVALEYLATEQCPPNLTIRVSMPLVGATPKRITLVVPVSTVTPGEPRSGAAHRCPSTEPGRPHTCAENGCYACWDQSVRWVDYRQH